MVPWKRFWILIIVGFTSASPAYFRQEHQRKQPQLRMKNQAGDLLATTTTGVFPTRTNTWQRMGFRVFRHPGETMEKGGVAAGTALLATCGIALLDETAARSRAQHQPRMAGATIGRPGIARCHPVARDTWLPAI